MASTTRSRARVHRVVPGRLRARPAVAAERQGAYDDQPDANERGAGEPRLDERAGSPAEPFGCPVLAELPALASVLEQLAVGDRAMLTAVAGLADLLRSDEVERTTGVGIDHWLAAVAAQTRMDRRLLVRTCRLLHRLPTLDAAVRAGQVSFAQLRGLTLALRGAPTELDGELDRLLAALLGDLGGMERPDPDVLVRQVADALDELHADDLAERERDATADRYLAVQPFLDGTGGRFSGQVDAAGLALLDAATTPPDDLLDHPGGLGAARLDTLLARLAGGGPAPDRHDDRPAAPAWWGGLAAPQLLVRLPFDALLDDRLPADLLTDLVGGRLRLTSAAARRLVDQRGAELRSVVIDDDGTVIGVGRSSRRPPAWLSDALAALHDTCTEPGCDRPARGADLDHAVPWWPVRPDDAPGSSDVDNVGPLCPTTNRAKEAAGWQVTQTGAGIRTWHHPRSGLTTTTIPATWRPLGDPRRRPRSADAPGRPPPRPAPPGPDGPGAVAPDHRPPPAFPSDRPPDDDGLPF